MDLHGKHLLEALSERGHEIIVISTRNPSRMEYEKRESIEIHYLKHTTFGSSRRGWARESSKKFLDIIKSEKIDIVVSQSTAGFSVSKIARKIGIPFVSIMHGYETMVLKSILNQVLNFHEGHFYLMKSFLSCIYITFFEEYPALLNSTSIIAVSHNVAKVLEKRPLINKKKISVIINGIDLNLFDRNLEVRKSTRRCLNILDQEYVLLFLGVISKQKGADIAIKSLKALSNHENVKLILAGDGEYLEEVKYLAIELGVEKRIIFTGYIPNEETHGYFNAADVFIFPTLRLESFGIVLAEAMACGKAVIASDIGSVSEVIDDGVNGILVPPGDFRNLSRAIGILLNDPKYSETLGQYARQKASRKFGLNRMVDKTIRVFDLAVRRSRAKR